MKPAPETTFTPRQRARVWPRVAGVLLLLAGTGSVFVWQNPEPLRRLLSPGAAERDSADARAREAAETRIKALEARLAQLEQRPMPADPAPLLAPLVTRLDTVEKRPQPVMPPPFDSRPLQTRLEALEARTATPLVASSELDLRPFIARIVALEQYAARPSVEPGKLDALSARIDTLAAKDPAADVRARVEALEKQITGLTATVGKVTEMGARVDVLEKQVSGVAATAGKVTEVSDRLTRVARLRAATLALNAGQKLGTIPDAPPALAKFANAAPPTETALRLAFPAAERAALDVSLPDMKGKPLLDRMLARLQDYHLITVRQGDAVVLGNTTAEALNHAHVLIDAGDLSGAIRTVETLTGEPAKAMAPWLADAKALLAAREALSALAGNG